MCLAGGRAGLNDGERRVLHAEGRDGQSATWPHGVRYHSPAQGLNEPIDALQRN